MRLLILTILTLGTMGVTPAHACKCAPLGAPCAEYWRASAVFAGTVREIRPVEARPGVFAILFDVDQRGRGVNSNTMVVESAPQNGANCGYTFTLGQRYFVYAQRTARRRADDRNVQRQQARGSRVVDLAFLKEVTGSPRGVRVFGHVSCGVTARLRPMRN